VSAAPHAETVAFLETVRGRLWAGRVVDVALRLVWTAAIISLAGGLVVFARWTSRAVAWRLAAAAMSVVLAIAIVVVSRRPSTRDAARRADAWFGAKDLMISAWDQLRRGPSERAPAAAFVLARADAMAALWRADVRRKSPPLRWARYYAPIALLMTGAFLDAVGGGAPPSALRSAGTPSSIPAMAEPANAPSGLLAWRAAPASPDAAAPMAEQHAARDGAPRAVAPATRRAGSVDASGDASSRVDGRSDSEAGGARAGDARPEEQDAAGTWNEQDLPVQRVDVPRAAGDQSTGAAVELETRPGRPAAMRPAAPPAARTVGVPLGSEVAPTRRGYVAAYLRAIGAGE
jgi:hypothetical protein